MIPKEQLKELYTLKNYSSKQIGAILGCSETKINYWMRKHHIKKRSVSEAVYIKWNPDGDPFKIKTPANVEEAILYGLGLGLYWGEGTKSNKFSIRLGNTDPRLIKSFIKFLQSFYGIDTKRIKFGLQIFNDLSKEDSLRFWQKELNASSKQFQKVIITPPRGVGTYKNKIKHGVLTVYFNNKKLRDKLCDAIENF